MSKGLRGRRFDLATLIARVDRIDAYCTEKFTSAIARRLVRWERLSVAFERYLKMRAAYVAEVHTGRCRDRLGTISNIVLILMLVAGLGTMFSVFAAHRMMVSLPFDLVVVLSILSTALWILYIALNLADEFRFAGPAFWSVFGHVPAEAADTKPLDVALEIGDRKLARAVRFVEPSLREPILESATDRLRKHARTPEDVHRLANRFSRQMLWVAFCQWLPRLVHAALGGGAVGLGLLGGLKSVFDIQLHPLIVIPTMVGTAILGITVTIQDTLRRSRK